LKEVKIKDQQLLESKDTADFTKEWRFFKFSSWGLAIKSFDLNGYIHLIKFNEVDIFVW